MTVEKMPQRLGVTNEELVVLRQKEISGCLLGSYKHLTSHLGSELLMKENEALAKLMHRLRIVQLKSAKTF